MYTRYEVYMYVYIHPYVHFLSFYALVVVIDDWNFVTCTAVSAQRRRRSLVCVKMYTHVHRVLLYATGPIYYVYYM